MTSNNKASALILIILGFFISSEILAHGGRYRGYRGHSHYSYRARPSFGMYFGPSYVRPFYPRYYPYDYYYYPPAVVTIPSSPPVYIEQGNVQPPPQNESNYWHYCDNPEGYYPYVKACPNGWQLVPPQPQD